MPELHPRDFRNRFAPGEHPGVRRAREARDRFAAEEMARIREAHRIVERERIEPIRRRAADALRGPAVAIPDIDPHRAALAFALALMATLATEEDDHV